MRLTKTISALAFACIVTSWGSAIADAAKGKRNFARCMVCHTLKPGLNRVGPSLHNVFGSKAGQAPKYKYSDSMKQAGEKGLVWTRENLMGYLEDPKAFLQKYLGTKRVKNKMFMKFKNKKFREDVIDYLESLKKKEKAS